MKEKGFSVLEVVIALGITVVIGTYLASILIGNSGFSYKQNAIVSEGLNLNDVMSKLNDSIKQAQYVAAGYPEASPAYSSDASTLVLKIPSINATGVIPNAFDFLVIVKDGSSPAILRLKLFPSQDPLSIRKSQDMVLTTILSSVQFDYLNKQGETVSPNLASSVSVTLTVMPKTGSIGSSRTSSSIINLRNN